MKDPFRRGIGNAVQWYDNLQGQLNDIADQALKAAAETITAIKLAGSQPSPLPHPHLPPEWDWWTLQCPSRSTRTLPPESAWRTLLR